MLNLLRRPVGRMTLVLLFAGIVTAPAVLFFDPATYAPNRRGHIARDPRDFYTLYSDDVAYVAASRTWDRTVANLLVPHNTHIVPAWRLVTWGLVALAGNLERLPVVLAVASYGILVAVMLMAGRLVARETGRIGLGLAAAAMVGTTSLMLTPAVWYSGGQPLWAGFGILATLWYVQSYRRNGRWLSLVLAALAAGLAGGFWSAGHLAGPVAAVYLWLDGRRRCRLAAAVPVAATAAAIVLMLSMATRPMDSRVSFHGRTVAEAFHPMQGAIITAQAIPEDLILGNLGLEAHTTPVQGILLTLGLIILWASRRWRRNADAPAPRSSDAATTIAISGADPREPSARRPPWSWFAFNPLECAGAAIVLGCYMLEWTFRGYFDYQYLRTHNMYTIVPWYDEIPQIGAVLFVIGWWSGPRRPAGSRFADGHSTPDRADPLRGPGPAGPDARPDRPQPAQGRCLDPAGQPARCSPRSRSSSRSLRLQTMRANLLLSLQVEWQRKYLKRLDQAEPVARRLGIGQDGIRAAFGSLYIPGSTGRLRPALHELYDVAAILDLPARGRVSDPAAVRAALARYLRPESNLGRTGSHRATNGAGRRSVRSPGASGSERASFIHRLGDGGEVLEPREVLGERQLDAIGAPVAVLGDDQLGDPRLVVGVVVIGSMKK